MVRPNSRCSNKKLVSRQISRLESERTLMMEERDKVEDLVQPLPKPSSLFKQEYNIKEAQRVSIVSSLSESNDSQSQSGAPVSSPNQVNSMATGFTKQKSILPMKVNSQTIANSNYNASLRKVSLWSIYSDGLSQKKEDSVLNESLVNEVIEKVQKELTINDAQIEGVIRNLESRLAAVEAAQSSLAELERKFEALEMKLTRMVKDQDDQVDLLSAKIGTTIKKENDLIRELRQLKEGFEAQNNHELKNDLSFSNAA